MRRSAGPFNALPAMIGETATTLSRRAATVSDIPGTESIGPMDTRGFEGQTITVSALDSDSMTPGLGTARLAPSKRMADTGTSWWNLTK